MRDPGHAGILSATPYTDVDPCANGMSTILCVRNSSFVVVVFRLTDGSTRATGVACMGVEPCKGVGAYPVVLPLGGAWQQKSTREQTHNDRHDHR